MGFAFEEGSGLPMVVGPDQAVGHPALPLLALHVQPEPVQSPEAQIGDIMLKVQRFADETAEDARRQARAVVADAQIEAAGIVTRARREAGKIAAQVALQATQAAPRIAPDAVIHLCSAIEEFATTNRVLVDELIQLRQALAGSYADTPIAVNGHFSAVPPPAG